MDSREVKGYVYILSNPSFSQVKIGYSDRDPIVRLDELHTTGVPTPFVLEYWVLVSDARNLERMIHEELKNFRSNPDREFFELEVGKTIGKIKEIIQKNQISIHLEDSRNSEKLVQLSNELALIIGEGPMTRSEVISKLWIYIKKNNLQDNVNKRNIHTDKKLRLIFHKDQITMYELAGLIGRELR